jgi:hypothetical protein
VLNVAARPQIERRGRTDSHLVRIALEQPLVRGIDERPTNTASLRHRFDGHEFDEADTPRALVGNARGDRPISGRCGDQDAIVVAPATELELVRRQTLVRQGSRDQGREVRSTFARPYVHYGRLEMGRVARLVLIALAAAVVVCSAGCSEYSGTQKPGPADGASLDFTSKATVVIDDNGISPANLRATVGEAVTVVNHGTVDRGLTSDTIDTGTLHPGDSTVLFLTAPGTIDAYDRTASSHRIEIDVSSQSS